MNGINEYLKKEGFDLELKEDRISSPEGDLVITEGEHIFFRENLIKMITDFKDKYSMEDEYRLKRAEEQGFDISKVYYHVTNNNFDNFDTSKSADGKIWLTEDKEQANSKTGLGASGSDYVKELYIRKGKMAGWREEDIYVSDQLISDGYMGAKLDEVVYLFNPEDIRDIGASFELENKDSVYIKDKSSFAINDKNIFKIIEDKYDDLQLKSFIQDKKKKNEIGSAAYNEKGEYLGVFLESLSDFGMSKADELDFKRVLLKNEPLEIAKNKNNEMDRFGLYGVRKAYTEKTGTVEQFLVKDPTGDLSWINKSDNNYEFTKTKQRKTNKIKP